MRPRSHAEWIASLSTDGKDIELAEFSARETAMTRSAVMQQTAQMQQMAEGFTAAVTALTAATQQLSRLEYLLERIWGAEERREIYTRRCDPRYPYSQVGAPEYGEYREFVDDYEALKADVLKGASGLLAGADVRQLMRGGR
jgi:hypothetical protein